MITFFSRMFLLACSTACCLWVVEHGATHGQTPPDLTIRKTHSSDFPVGFMGRYEIVVSNAMNAGPTTGPITVTDNLPSNLGLSLGFGAGWNCVGTSNIACTHAGPLAAGASLPTLQLNVTVGFGTPTGTNSITNTASVSTPGETNTADNTASDPTTVLKRASQISIANVAPNPALNCLPVTVNFTISNPGLGGPPTSGTVMVTDGVSSCTSTLNGSASGTCSFLFNTPGAHTLTARYSGNADFEGSTSAPVTVQVNTNTPPVLGTYPSVMLRTRESFTVVPSAPPTDDGGSISLSVTSPGIVPFIGALNIHPTTGAVTITTARPPGSFPILVTATDNCGARTTQIFTLTVTCSTITINPPILPNAPRGLVYSQFLRADGATYPVTFSLLSGTLPPGLTLSDEGRITGTATDSGSYTFTVKVTDPDGCTGTRQYTLDQGCAAFTIVPTQLLDGYEGLFFGRTFEGFGGTPPYTYGIQSGTLPPGLTFSTENQGYISGTPIQRGSYTFVVKATDANGCLATRSYTINIGCPEIELRPLTLPEMTIGTAYRQMFTANGGIAPHTFSLQSGTLPPGLSLSNEGLLAGTPTQVGTQAGPFVFTVKVTSASGCTGTRQYVLGCPTITVGPNGPNVTLTTVFTASGGTGPYTFSIATGMLPYGLAFSSEGRFVGFAMSVGVFAFTVKATDANGCSGTNNYVLDLTTRPTISKVSPSALIAGGGAFTLTINGSNFLSGAKLTWSGSERPTTLVSSTQLRAEISAADVAEAKTILLTVTNPPPLGIPSPTFPFTIYSSTTRFEGDVWPRREGDGLVEAADVEQMARFALKLDALPAGAEFQRADCSPSQSRGDGRFGLADVVQTQHYANGIGVLAEAGGPTATQNQNDESAQEELQIQPSGPLTLTNSEFTRGQIGALTVQLHASGGETAVSFTLNYDNTRLTFLDAIKADFFSSAQVFVNDTQPGKLGVVFLLAAGQKLEGGANPLFNLRFLPHGGSGSGALAFSFSDELAARATVSIDLGGLRQQALTTINSTSTLSGVAPAFLSAASFNGGATLAPNSIVAAFGTGLATMSATATSLPLPTSLGGITVTIADRTNTQHAAPLFFVSSGQINFLLPAAVVEGAAFVSIRTAAGAMASGILRVNAVAPALFAAAANGRGLAAAQFLRVLDDGTQRYEPVARFDPITGQFVAVPFEFAPAGEQVFLVLYGSGLRGRSTLANVTAALGGIPAEVLFVGNQGGLAGLDQVNLRLPRTLAGRGEVDVLLTVEGRTANPVRVNFK
jgi:uncharacterized protein (TIGR03437 family)